MRCKNCGTENDDNRYICENCGSPLYDDGDITAQEETAQDAYPVDEEETDDQKALKKNVIIIAVLAVILVAVIVSIIVVARGSAEKETTTQESTAISTTLKEKTTETTTKEETTEEETTTEETTEAETEKTTTAAKEYTITASTKVGGSVSGGGTFKQGDTVVLKATAEDGYEFAGWYSDGVLKSSAATYQFEATANGSYTAVFNVSASEIEQMADTY